ncbi:MAG: hypothetical protein ACI86H_001229 [bacterium]|jgi:hypothetical protein
MFEPEQSELDQWLARAIVNIILSDQRIASSELDLIQSRKSLGLLGINETVHDLIKQELRNIGNSLEFQEIDIDSKRASSYLLQLAKIAATDGMIVLQEGQSLYQFAKLLGFSKEIIPSVLDWAIGHARINEESEKLEQQAKETFIPRIGKFNLEKWVFNIEVAIIRDTPSEYHAEMYHFIQILNGKEYVKKLETTLTNLNKFRPLHDINGLQLDYKDKNSSFQALIKIARLIALRRDETELEKEFFYKIVVQLGYSQPLFADYIINWSQQIRFLNAQEKQLYNYCLRYHRNFKI